MYEKQSEWLKAAFCELRPYVEQCTGKKLQAQYVACAEPNMSPLDFFSGENPDNIMGQCTKDGRSIKVCPSTLAKVQPGTDDEEILGVLAHEMIHSALPWAGHSPEFAQAAHNLGLVGDPRCTHAGPGFRMLAAKIFYDIGRPPVLAYEYDDEDEDSPYSKDFTVEDILGMIRKLRSVGVV